MFMQKKALITSGVIFALLAISHAVRWLSPVKILINGNTLPLIVSLFSGIILALLSVWMFISAKQMKSTSKEDIEKEENYDDDLAKLCTDLGDLWGAQLSFTERLGDFLDTETAIDDSWRKFGDSLADICSELEHMAWHIQSVKDPIERIAQRAYQADDQKMAYFECHTAILQDDRSRTRTIRRTVYKFMFLYEIALMSAYGQKW